MFRFLAHDSASARQRRCPGVSGPGLGCGGHQADIGLEVLTGDYFIDLVVVDEVPPGAALAPVD